MSAPPFPPARKQRNLRRPKQPEMCLKRLFLTSCLLLAAAPALAQTDEELRKSFLATFANGCVAEQRKAAPNAQISDAAIRSYCTCFGEGIPGAISAQEMRQIGATGAMTPAIQSRLTAVGKSCLDRLKQ